VPQQTEGEDGTMSGPQGRWVAPHATSLAEALAELDAGAALAEGRVFVGGRRARDAAERLEPGDRVDIYAARKTAAELEVLYRSEGLAVVDKPAGIATEPERRGSNQTVVALAARALGLALSEVHALSRLDVGVSGVVLLGLDAEARRHVTTLRAEGRVRRRYVALAAGTPTPSDGDIRDPILHVQGQVRRRTGSGGEAAETHYRVLGSAHGVSVLALEPLTGRTHQLRVHAAAREAPLLGDRTYGGPARLTLQSGSVQRLERVFLHAAWLELDQGARIESPLPDIFYELWAKLGGDPRALADATA
jgi:RluA family pseudouridine synthase